VQGTAGNDFIRALMGRVPQLPHSSSSSSSSPSCDSISLANSAPLITFHRKLPPRPPREPLLRMAARSRQPPHVHAHTHAHPQRIRSHERTHESARAGGGPALAALARRGGECDELSLRETGLALVPARSVGSAVGERDKQCISSYKGAITLEEKPGFFQECPVAGKRHGVADGVAAVMKRIFLPRSPAVGGARRGRSRGRERLGGATGHLAKLVSSSLTESLSACEGQRLKWSTAQMVNVSNG